MKYLNNIGKMGFKNLLSIFLVIVIIHIATSSAKKQNGKDSVNKKETDEGLDTETGLSSELQQLRELASKESGSIILKPKHGPKKNKHHHSRRRRPHGRGRPNKKNRTRPLDILKAEDDPKISGRVHDSETTRDHDTKSQQRIRSRTRGSRHRNLESKTTVTHEGGKHHHHRRPRTHHHSKTDQHNSRNGHGLITANVDREPILHKTDTA